MLVKLGSYYKAHDAKQNDIQVDKFLISRWPVRSNGKIFVIKVTQLLGKKRRRSLANKGSLLQQS